MEEWHVSNPSADRWERSEPMGRTAEEDRLLNVKEAAAMLSLKPSTLYQWAYERRIPTVKLYGRALRFRLSVIQRLMAQFERPALRPLARETE